MTRLLVFLCFVLLMLPSVHAQDSLNSQDPQATYLKEIARGFYQDLWFSNNTEAWDKYVADEYYIHDIGMDRLGEEPGIIQGEVAGDNYAVEAGITQKEIADFFWENGEMSGDIQYQLTHDDMVATRWIWHYRPTTLLGRFMVGEVDLPIINVFRIRNGKIVEIWNHRHDIDTNRTNIYLMKGILYGLLFALIPLIWALYLRRKLKRSKTG